MKNYEATEIAYKNGYQKGYADGKRDLMMRIRVTKRSEARLYWKPVSNTERQLTCSACGSHLGCRENSAYCPECGAKFKKPKAVAPFVLEVTDG